MARKGKPILALLAAFVLTAGAASANPDCGLCARSVVINSALASCFLARFPEWQARANGAVVVDLTACPGENERGVVAALPEPGAGGPDLDAEFIVTLDQLVCLKRKLEDPTLVLDPSATIDLGACE